MHACMWNFFVFFFYRIDVGVDSCWHTCMCITEWFAILGTDLQRPHELLAADSQRRLRREEQDCAGD